MEIDHATYFDVPAKIINDLSIMIIQLQLAFLKQLRHYVYVIIVSHIYAEDRCKA